MGFLSGLVSAGASLIGGSMQDRSARKQAEAQYKYDLQAMRQQNKYNKNAEKRSVRDQKAAEQRQYSWNERTEKERFNWLVQGAENAGFNPLTVLGATGGRSGNSPTAQAGITIGSQAATQKAPLGQIGNTVARAGEQFAAYMPDPIETQTRMLQNQLLTKQIAQIDRENLRFGQPRLSAHNGNARTQTGDDWAMQTPLWERTKTGPNKEVDVPVGPDFSEVFMGMLIDQAATGKKKAPFRRGREAYVTDRITTKLQKAHQQQQPPLWIR